MSRPASAWQGVVTNVARSRCLAAVGDNEVEFHVPGSMIRDNGGRNPVRVGDRVTLALRSGTLVLQRIEERTSEFQRTHSEQGRSPRAATIAANLAMAAFVLPATAERRHLRMLDRMLVGACWADIPALVCVNKWDLVTDPGNLRNRLRPYRDEGWPICYTIAPAGDGVSGLLDLLPPGLSAFIGPSGAGKTTLIRAITGRADLKTLGVNSRTGKGRHVTTAVSAYQVDADRWVVDAPGLKTFGVAQAPQEMVLAAFPEIERAAGSCRQRWCDHEDRGGCRVAADIRSGAISRERWASYRLLIAEAVG
ncbi:MAG: ribosome small subunit-dependent GTPase A [Chloroflexota bacterium]|nr:ribosome small subunit-dependent GTPase A [Chloroflexota bacterium]